MKVQVSKMPNPRPQQQKKITNATANKTKLFIHLPYHPNNPYKNELSALTNKLKTDLGKGGLDIDRIITAYSKGPSIGDLCKRHKLEGYIDTLCT